MNMETQHIVLQNGDQMYICNGKAHREDGPAIMKAEEQEWFFDGIPHRADGPARLFKKTRICEWWNMGHFLTSAVIEQKVFDTYWKDK
jgi:hypothetical protein